jgi:hypothetical protein
MVLDIVHTYPEIKFQVLQYCLNPILYFFTFLLVKIGIIKEKKTFIPFKERN